MPIYEYRCNSCGKEIEVMQKISEEPLKSCSSCGGELKRLISNTTFILKGSGWYVTDYGRKKGLKDDKKEKTGDSPKESSSKDKG